MTQQIVSYPPILSLIQKTNTGALIIVNEVERERKKEREWTGTITERERERESNNYVWINCPFLLKEREKQLPKITKLKANQNPSFYELYCKTYFLIDTLVCWKICFSISSPLNLFY